MYPAYAAIEHIDLNHQFKWVVLDVLNYIFRWNIFNKLLIELKKRTNLEVT